MPKAKTNRSAQKRFKVGGTGRVKRAQAFKSHLTAGRPPKRIRQLRERVDVSSANIRSVKRMLPNRAKASR